MLQNGQETPIMVRQDGERFVLVEGLHRLEACRSLGEETVKGSLVSATSLTLRRGSVGLGANRA
jgi:ParB-like chromosome segregation protein Spo0J